VDDDIKNLYEAFKIYNKRFVTHSVVNYEIYSMTWDDVFKSYELRYRFLLNKLNLDKQAFIGSLNVGEPSKETADALREKITDLGN
jgi:hypothetical protein